ncbi:G-patch domain-containing protein.03 [Ceratocystis platani]|uniref:G-patch domain-containing protein.03 n=1 Tax=Ceratocystis fimbriata f. sp. platani TaxID=88771 RepID=A0A0F8B481_CERFI|nr:G-patch domain-containing protein.03 [Ceratocystis platani]
MYGAPKFNKAFSEVYSDSDEDDDRDSNAGESGSEFQPRKRRRMDKDRAALGIFGDDSDDEDSRPSQRWKKKTLRTQGLSFVSGGQQTRNTGNDSSADENARGSGHLNEDLDRDEDEDEDMESDGFTIDTGGLGSSTRGGLGFSDTVDIKTGDQEESGLLGRTSFLRGGISFSKASLEPDNEEDNLDEFETPSFAPKSFKSTSNIASTAPVQAGPKPTAARKSGAKSAKFDADMPFGKGFVPSSAYTPVLRDDLPDDSRAAPQAPKSSAFASGQKSKFGNSFAQRMMLKMGYVEGQGLGKESQGRNVIIEANLRPQGVGLGAVKEKSEKERKEERRQAQLRGEKLEDDSDEERERKATSKKSLRRSAGNSGTSTPRNKTPKAKFLTADELKKMAPGLHIPAAFAPILDMTGPGEKTLTSVTGLMSTNFTSGSSELPEVAERRKLIKRAHMDLAIFSEEWNSLVDRKAWAEKQLEEMEQAMEDLTMGVQNLTEFAQIVENELPLVGGWKETVTCLEKAVASGAVVDEMSDIIVAAIHPFIRDADWDPLKEPDRFAADLQPLRAVLLQNGFADADENPHADPRGSGLVADVKRKLRALVGSWDFAKGTVPGLTAWEAVLGKEWSSLLIGHVLPCIGRFLRRHFRVDPADQAPYLPALQGVLQWKDVLGRKALGEVVSTQVFPMWHEKLDEWLGLEEVNLAEIADWFQWWNAEVYPKEIQIATSTSLSLVVSVSGSGSVIYAYVYVYLYAYV